MSTGNGSFQRYLALGLWVLIGALFLSLAHQWVSYSSSDKQFSEYLQSMIQRAALDHRQAMDVRTLVMSKAKELSIPIQGERVRITGQGDSLRTVIDYDAEIKIPLVDHVLYRMEFNHNFGYQAPRPY
jgi:hypothetical protein